MAVILPRADQDQFDLTRLLNRLEHSLLTPDVDASLRRSLYHRRKINANIEHAQNILLRLEHDNPPATVKSQKDAVQMGLQEKRLRLKRLQNQLYELEQLDKEEEDESMMEGEDEDLLSIYAPDSSPSYGVPVEEKQAVVDNSAVIEKLPEASESQIRSRHNLKGGHEDQGKTSGADVDARSKLFASAMSPNSDVTNASKSSGEEELLSRHAAEQEALTSSLLNMATALKTSTQAFSDTLSSSNPLVDRATAALDRNVGGMEAAEKRMGLLRRMTEGKGWWARLSLYAYIAILWVVLILIMFVMPKLRF